MAKALAQQHNVSRFNATIRRVALPSVLVLPLAAVMLVALALAVGASFESLKFARGLGQVLNVIGAARRYAAVQAGFGQQPGEDILGMLARNSQIEAQMADGQVARIINPWGGDMHAILTAPSILQVDAVMPPKSCRRLGAYFMKAAKDFTPLEFAAHEADAPWRLAYNGNAAKKVDEAAMEAICGYAGSVTVAMSFKLR